MSKARVHSHIIDEDLLRVCDLAQEEQLQVIRVTVDRLQGMVDQLIAKANTGNLSRAKKEWDLIDLNRALVTTSQILARETLGIARIEKL